MPGGDVFIMILFFWTFVGSGVDGERVTGVLYGRVELRGRYGQNPDVEEVEWTKLSPGNGTRLLYKLCKANKSNSFNFSQNIAFNLQSMSLILLKLTKEDEGIYEEKTIFKNNITRYNITLSLLSSRVVSNITVSSSADSLTLKCEINGEFQLLRWFRNGSSLPDAQRFSLTENNKTMQVFDLSSSDCGTYTCQVSNEHAVSEAQVSVSGEILDICINSSSSALSDFIKHPLFPVGLSLISLLVLCIILLFICKCSGHKKVKTTPKEEPVYNEPTPFQEEPAPPTVNPLIVYQDFIKQKDSHQSEDFGYSTIAEVLQNVQPS